MPRSVTQPKKSRKRTVRSPTTVDGVFGGEKGVVNHKDGSNEARHMPGEQGRRVREDEVDARGDSQDPGAVISRRATETTMGKKFRRKRT